jgi:hypothetical protein
MVHLVRRRNLGGRCGNEAGLRLEDVAVSAAEAADADRRDGVVGGVFGDRAGAVPARCRLIRVKDALLNDEAFCQSLTSLTIIAFEVGSYRRSTGV